MPLSKVKNVFIIALIITNIFLLYLVLPQIRAQSVEYSEIGESVTALYAEKQIALDWSIVPRELELYELGLDTDKQVESQVALTLLGPSISVDDSAGIGKRVYEGQNGSAEFKKTGEFVITLTTKVGGGPETAPDTLAQMGIEIYGDIRTENQGDGKTRLTVVQSVMGAPVYSSGITLIYDEQGMLEQIYGKWYTSSAIPADAKKTVGAKTALVRFLYSRDSLGWVCASIVSLEQGYIEESSPVYGVSALIPVWRIQTDTGVYYIDGLTCGITNNL